MSESAEESIYPWRAKDAHLSSDVEIACRAMVYENNRHERPDIGITMNMRQLAARDAAIRREALENIRDVVLDKLIDLFNEMREELEEPK